MMPTTIVIVVEPPQTSPLEVIAWVTGGIVASAAILRSAVVFWRRTYGSAWDLQRRLGQLAIGVSDRFVEQLLGVPTFGQSSSDDFSNAIWVTRHCLLAATFDKGDIFAYSIVVRDPRFHYSLDDPTLTQMRGRLGRTKLSHLTTHAPMRVRAGTGASTFRYAEEHYFGRPGGYHYYVLAVGDTGANVAEPPNFQIEPDNNASIDEIEWPEHLHEYRRTASPNSFTVVGHPDALDADRVLSRYVASAVLSPHYRRSRGWAPWRRVSRY